MDWKQVKDEIEREIDKIWFKEPLEITCAKRGLFPGNASTEGQAAGNLLFMVVDSSAMSSLVFSPTMFHMLDNDVFGLEQCKIVYRYMTLNKVKIAGLALGPNTKCPAAWLNLPKFYKFCQMILDSYDTITNKEDFKDLLWSWFNYVERMCKWTYTMFPLDEIGKNLPAKNDATMTEEEKQLCRDADLYDYTYSPIKA